MVCDACGSTGPFEAIEHWSTVMGYIPSVDAEGKTHLHDGNITTTVYRCGCGRRLLARARLGACWCGWTAAEAYRTPGVQPLPCGTV
jgi:hypothetical protein